MNNSLPKHIAVIPDGNGRWARLRNKPRIFGYNAGKEAVKTLVKLCVNRKISALTIFAFSTENWLRPPKEVEYLMNLFVTAFDNVTQKLHDYDVKIQVIGDRSAFSKKLQQRIIKAETLTENNKGLKFNIAANYGGRADIVGAAKKIAEQVKQGELSIEDIDENKFSSMLCTVGLTEPDLFIRTSGEKRISNYLIWQLAYSELYFTDVMWPDFNEDCFNRALEFYASRERRFGYTGEQIKAKEHA